MKEFWDQRYSAKEYAYGEAPNSFFAEQIATLKPGKILLPCEGEGRNGVYAAKLGWEVYAFDISKEGKNKAMQLAEQNNVQLSFDVNSFENINYPKSSFDAVALIFAHYHKNTQKEYHKILSSYLKPGGHIIMEAFHHDHLEYNSKNPKSGGPKHPDLLFHEDHLREDFSDFDIILLEKKETELKEGKFHIGESVVVRLVARKNNL